MTGIYKSRGLRPMLLSESKPFDDPDFIFEFKYDGARALMYITEKAVSLISRNGNDFTSCFPEFSRLYQNTAAPCILDGEIFGLKNGIPDFSVYLKRGQIFNPLKAALAAQKHPLKFAAFDILYLKNENLTALPLTERKKILSEILTPDETILQVGFIENYGTKLFETAKTAFLEGIVAKRKTSVYLPGKRTKDWKKIKVTKGHNKPQ